MLNEETFFDQALAARRSRLGYRFGIAGVIAIAFSARGDWEWPLAWYLVYALVNLLDDRLLAWRETRPDEARRRFVLLPCIGIAASNLCFITVSLPATLEYGAWGVLAFGFLTSGITLYSVMAAQASLRAFLAAILPLSTAFVALPFLAYRADGGLPSILIVVMGSILTIVAVVGQWRDGAKMRRSEMAARARAEAGEAAKTRFLAMVSHDLRTPLMAIRAGAEHISREGHRHGLAPIVEDAGLVEDAASMMRRLLDDLLDMFKTEAGQMTIDPRPVDVRARVADLVRFWHPTAADKGLTLIWEAEPDLGQFLSIDPTRLRQILNNLVSNALKFTDQGGVRLHLSVQGASVRITVTDSGPGLAPEEASRLFLPYVQTEVGMSHGGGTGLGLVISRDLARAMGGDLIVTSQKGEGACFALTLPLTEVDSDEGEVPTSLPDAEDLSILVVDDHPINRKALALLLESLAAVPAFAASGTEALAMLEQQPFDLVLMDVNMPGMDGCETTRRLRATSGLNAAVPVIAVTGSTSKADIAACRAAGMDGWVPKPIGAAELFVEIDRVLTVGALDRADVA